MMDTVRLAAMANQIASFFATQRGESGALEVADHLRRHRQLGGWLDCEMGLSQVGRQDDSVRRFQLRRLSLPG